MFQDVCSPVSLHTPRCQTNRTYVSRDQFDLRVCMYCTDTGYHAGSQHLFGESQGKITKELRTAHAENAANSSSKYVTFGEPRVFERVPLTTKPSTENGITGINNRGHLIGYTGHCPAMREAIGERFGVATKDALYEKSQKEKWFSAHPPVMQLATEVSRADLPKQLGSTRDTTIKSQRANELDSKGRSVFNGSKLPGYSGFTPGSRSEYGKTYGAMHRAMDKDADGDAAAMSTGKGGASPGTSVGTTADRAVWSDRSPRTPRVVTTTDRQLPGCESAIAPLGFGSFYLTHRMDDALQTRGTHRSIRAREARSCRPTLPKTSRLHRLRYQLLLTFIARSV